MRPDADLMKRLAAADPLRDAEQLDPEAQREADALLARLLATPPEPDAVQRRRPRLRRWTLAAAGVTGVAAVAFTAANLLDSDSPGPGVVDQALAAKTVAALTREDAVYHVVERRRGTRNIPGADVGPFLAESWHSSEGQFHEKVFADTGGRRGRLLEEVAGKHAPGRGVGAVLRYDPMRNLLVAEGIGRNADELPALDPNANPGTTLKALQARGLLREEGTTRIGNRRAYRLVSDPIDVEGSEQRFEYLVDSETYLPLRQRSSLRRGSEVFEVLYEYLVYEPLALNARSRAQLDLDPHPGATCAVYAGEPGKPALGFENPCPASGREGRARTP